MTQLFMLTARDQTRSTEELSERPVIRAVEPHLAKPVSAGWTITLLQAAPLPVLSETEVLVQIARRMRP